MKRKLINSGVVLLAISLGAAIAQDKGGAPGGGRGRGPAVPGMALSSPDFQDGGIIPDKYTQAAGRMAPSPKLEWSNVPMGTMSFVLIMHDPDNASKKGPDDTLHWMAFNIPGTSHGLDGGVPNDAKLADGTIQARGIQVGYFGPGNGAINPYHHYTWELYALDAMLPLDAMATRTDVLTGMAGHVIGKAVLEGRFKMPATPAPAAK
jgi:Raf kinase inhibitor-like YbhB/YbcL family protein